MKRGGDFIINAFKAKTESHVESERDVIRNAF